MFKKTIQIIFLVFLLAAAGILQYSFVLALPPLFSTFNLMLIILVFTLFFYDFRSASGVALVGGLVLDFYSFHFFGFHMLTLFLTAWASELVLKSLLTNRSLYSFGMLIFTATLIYNLVSGLLAYFFSGSPAAFFLLASRFWLALAYQIIWCEISALVLFNFAGQATRRLKPFFLEKQGLL